MPSFYDKAASGLPEGHSGYFTGPAKTLDPSLFDGEHLRHDVRIWLLHTLENGLRRYLDLTGVNEWLHAWLAGSGITYQWDADRGNGDLDVLFGVDMARFTHWNPDYQGVPERNIADLADDVLRERMWPKTAHQRLGRQTYEITFYWNPGTGTDITRIKPYAAYDLKRDTWAVRPPDLPHDPRSLYPGEWFQAASRDTEAAHQIASRHLSLTEDLSRAPLGSPQAQSLTAEIGRTREAARTLLDDIHLGRREAFGEQGTGYGDWHNFRWQHAKQDGVVEGLSALVKMADADKKASDEFLYGGPIDPADKLITRAMIGRDKRP